MKQILFLFIVSLSIISCNTNEKSNKMAFAAISSKTYYVSATGNDANNGTSETTPWKTIQKAESISGSLQPGDAILFKCGDAFTGKAMFKSKSGTASAPILIGNYGTGEKPTFYYPTGGSLRADSRVLFNFYNVSYYIIDGLKFSDSNKVNNKVTPANCGFPIYIGNGGGKCNNFIVQNVEIELCGMGVVLVGDYNTVQNCKMTNFRNLLSTPNTGGNSQWEDYGANPFTIINGNDNKIFNNYISGGWAESLDFGFNGGFCEMFNNCNRNMIMYNTIIDCNGLSEFGANSGNSISNDNIYAYNKLIDNGAMFYSNISGPFACQVGNVQFFSNTVVETANSRFALGSPNAGAGVVTPEAISHINLDSYMFLYNGTPTASTVYDLKDNVFNIANPLKICRSSESRLKHDYDVFKLSAGSAFYLTLGAHEANTSAVIFKSASGNATTWDLHPMAGSALIGKGIYIPGLDYDFEGKKVNQTAHNIGIYESDTTSTPTCIAKSDTQTIPCPVGQTGIITQVRQYTCPEGVWSAWANISNTCATPPPTFSYTVNTSWLTITSSAAGHYRLYKKSKWTTTELKFGTYGVGVTNISVRGIRGNIKMDANGQTYNFTL